MIKYLIEVICVFYLVRTIARWLLGSLFQGAVNNAQQQQSYRQQQTRQQQSRPREGTIKIEHMPAQKKQQVPDSEGDFIDYEEVK
ncbi:uncharacterized protein DUF4834 [Mucilaginibacter yixingensis]|uniref:Uncharacterized protein DUF4834 n=1 Tax=Mucilaginibacter yixingensis TaxID=1295612 RepID=A0A2T5JCF3_9SPHI|nr:DUF4834 family protein [Mucilaginibacter yixingensis]PTQ99441.1 uncharacterized protein DUF4834 [Mucilaginibacter yixingensis]